MPEKTTKPAPKLAEALSFRVTRDELAALRVLAAEQDRTVGWIVRHAVREFYGL